MIFSLVVLTSLLGTVDERFFIKNFLDAKTNQHWTLDRQSNREMVSVAATGLGFYAYARGSRLGIISKQEAQAWIRSGFDNMLACNKDNSGWLYHFVDLEGRNYRDSEVSSIDTTIFYAGAERAAGLLDDQSLLDHIRKRKSEIDLSIMIDETGYFYHGFTWENGRRKILKSKWTHYNEGILIYKYFNKPFVPVRTHYDLPLFCYYYPMAFYPDEPLWKLHLGRAIDFQLEQTGRFGYSAIDTENGYKVNSPFYISPLAIYSCQSFFPFKCKRELAKLPVDRITQSVSVNGKWASQDRILIDEGICLILIKDMK